MVSRLLTGNAAAAWGARLAGVDYVPAFPITPQTEIIEKLARWVSDGTLDARFVTMDSEHSMLSAAGGAATTGARVFSATSSQGLLHGMEALYTVAGWRVPLVLVNVSRGLSAPITLGPDHDDILAARDSGCLQIHCETCQEVLDSVLIAYRMAEDPRVCLPVIVNLDGFFLSFTREPVDVPSPEAAAAFLPPYEPPAPVFRGRRPMAQGVAVLDGAGYSWFRYQMHRAQRNALEVHREVAGEFLRRFGRSYDVVDAYRIDDAEVALVMIGCFATCAKAAVDRWRDDGVRVGLVRPRVVRPWPHVEIVDVLAPLRAIAVVDQNLAPGLGGIVFQEVASSLAWTPRRTPRIRSFVVGLGGKALSDEELDHIIESLIGSDVSSSGDAELLLTAGELERVRAAQSVAGKASPDEAAEKSP